MIYVKYILLFQCFQALPLFPAVVQYFYILGDLHGWTIEGCTQLFYQQKLSNMQLHCILGHHCNCHLTEIV